MPNGEAETEIELGLMIPPAPLSLTDNVPRIEDGLLRTAKTPTWNVELVPGERGPTGSPMLTPALRPQGPGRKVVEVVVLVVVVGLIVVVVVVVVVGGVVVLVVVVTVSPRAKIVPPIVVGWMLQ